MHEPDIERILGRVRPVGPPSHLRARAVGALSTPSPWPWAVAAAILLGLTGGIHLATERLIEDSAPITPATALPFDDMAARLGGDLIAHQLAAILVAGSTPERRDE